MKGFVKILIQMYKDKQALRAITKREPKWSECKNTMEVLELSEKYDAEYKPAKETCEANEKELNQRLGHIAKATCRIAAALWIVYFILALIMGELGEFFSVLVAIAVPLLFIMLMLVGGKIGSRDLLWMIWWGKK